MSEGSTSRSVVPETLVTIIILVIVSGPAWGRSGRFRGHQRGSTNRL